MPNDDFLNQHRKPPPREFVDRLYQKLLEEEKKMTQQTNVISMPQNGHPPFETDALPATRRYRMRGLSALAAATALVLFGLVIFALAGGLGGDNGDDSGNGTGGFAAPGQGDGSPVANLDDEGESNPAQDGPNNPTPSPIPPGTISPTAPPPFGPATNLHFSPNLPPGVEVVEIEAGETLEGELSEQQPAVVYRLTAEADGLLHIVAEADDFEARVGQYGSYVGAAPPILDTPRDVPPPMLTATADSAISASATDDNRPGPQLTAAALVQRATADHWATEGTAPAPPDPPTATFMPTTVPTGTPVVRGYRFSGGHGQPQRGLLRDNEALAWVSEGQEIVFMVTGDGPGEYTLSVEAVEPVEIEAGDPAEDQLSDERGFGYYMVELDADTPYAISVTGEDGFDTDLYLASIDPPYSAYDLDSGAGLDPELFGLEVPETGTYYLLVISANPDATGAFLLQVNPLR
jgi:hypothetical protein